MCNSAGCPHNIFVVSRHEAWVQSAWVGKPPGAKNIKQIINVIITIDVCIIISIVTIIIIIIIIVIMLMSTSSNMFDIFRNRLGSNE